MKCWKRKEELNRKTPLHSFRKITENKVPLKKAKENFGPTLQHWGEMSAIQGAPWIYLDYNISL